MNRPLWLVTALFVVGIVTGSYWFAKSRTPAPADPGTLNVLLITLDTTRADFLGCYGSQAVQTPNLDQLASQGALFENCTTCTSLTLPSHCSIMTGVYPFVHGVRKNGTNRLPSNSETLAEILKAAGLHTRAIVASFVLNRMFGIDQGFEGFSEVSRGANTIALHAERRGDEVCEDALGALRDLSSDRFFLWVHFYDPHYPYVATGAGLSSPTQAYAQEIEFTDRQIGRLIEELAVLGLTSRTLVVVVGDHGEAFSEHEEYQHGYFVYDTTLRVPLIFRCPGTVPPGRKVQGRVRTIDVAATICDFLHQKPLSRQQGHSLMSLIRGDSQDLDLNAYGESLEGHLQFGLSPLRSLHHESWKYILAPRPELYDLHDDPGELNNLIDRFPERAAQMRQRLRSIIAAAPPPPPDDAAALELSAADLAMLQSLGYTGGIDTQALQGDEQERFEPIGKDPKDFTEAITLYSQSHWALTAGQLEYGESLLRRLVDRVPSAAHIRADLAFVLQEQQKTAEALVQYERAVALAPDDGYVRRMYGGLLMRMGRWDAAVEQLTRAVADRPDDLEGWYNLGVAVASQGRFAQARNHFERALVIDPKHVSSIHALGAAYLREGMLHEAEDCFGRALRINPSHRRSQQDLQRVQQRLHQRG
ncbi:MAG: sulfatase-like hydrolase/transferase [Phycisphaerae bacterium]